VRRIPGSWDRVRGDPRWRSGRFEVRFPRDHLPLRYPWVAPSPSQRPRDFAYSALPMGSAAKAYLWVPMAIWLTGRHGVRLRGHICVRHGVRARACARPCALRGFMVAARSVSSESHFRFSLFSPDFCAFSCCESPPHV
jgi:hypothetical protein